MINLKHLLVAIILLGLCTGCSKPASVEQAEKTAPVGSSAFRLYVTNELSGDMTVIDSATYNVIATVPLGKRPRGIHASPDRKTIYVALSGSPIAGPDVDESTLPPPDKSADGIGVFDVNQNKLVRIIKGGSDPENFDISPDGKQLYISNEDVAEVSVLDVASGAVIKSAKVGGEPEGVEVTPDGKQVLFLRATAESPELRLHEYDVATGKTRELLAPAVEALHAQIEHRLRLLAGLRGGAPGQRHRAEGDEQQRRARAEDAANRPRLQTRAHNAGHRTGRCS